MHLKDFRDLTMHNENFLYLHNWMSNIYKHKEPGLDELYWLVLVAPNSASTIILPRMAYNTPVPLLMAGQGILGFCLPFFFLCALVPAAAPLDNPGSLEVITGPVFPRPEASTLSCSSSILLCFRSCPSLYNSPFTSTSGLLNHWPNNSSFPTLSQLCLSPGLYGATGDAVASFHPPFPLPTWWRQWWWQPELVHPGWRGRGLTRLKEGNWHQERISPEFGQELLLPELVPPPFAGALVLVTPIEFNSDFKHISTFYGVIM